MREAEQIKTHRLYRARGWLVALWLLAVVTYHMPWTSHKTAAFTQNAFDLAEQVGIHPGIVAENPPMRTSGLLRAGLPFIAGGLALTGLLFSDIRLRWLWRFFAALIALRVIPSESALRSPDTLLNNDKATQMLILTAVGLLLVGLTIPAPLRRGLRAVMLPAQILLLGLALALPLIGYNRAFELLGQLGLEVAIGGGLWLYGLVLLGMLPLLLRARTRTTA